MRMYDIIQKKRDGNELTKEEIAFLIQGYVDGSIPDYQMAAFLMAVYYKGMTESETHFMTMEVAHSGDMVDLSAIEGIKVDKHSTGGVGDKTTLIVAPTVAVMGGVVAKMSGRGLGHTGGTVDKLESIPGYKTTLTSEEFTRQVKDIGISVIGQSGNLAPADKKLYALRDVTATVNSIPLIASSIMSKKLAAGTDVIVLDVKVGSGAFMKSLEQARELANCMVDIGTDCGKKTAAVITNMDIPLGRNIGNALEIKEAISVLKGDTDSDLATVSIALAANMVSLLKGISITEAEKMVTETLKGGRAYEKFLEWISAQGGDISVFDNLETFGKAEYSCDITAERDGYILKMDAETLGRASVMLGAGRTKKDDVIDYSAGIVLSRKTGDKVNKGDTVATLYSSTVSDMTAAAEMVNSAITLGDNPPEKQTLIYEVITK